MKPESIFFAIKVAWAEQRTCNATQVKGFFLQLFKIIIFNNITRKQEWRDSLNKRNGLNLTSIRGHHSAAYKITRGINRFTGGKITEQITSESSIRHQIMCFVQQTTTSLWSSFSIYLLTLPSNQNQFPLPITDAYVLYDNVNLICWVTCAEEVLYLTSGQFKAPHVKMSKNGRYVHIASWIS